MSKKLQFVLASVVLFVLLYGLTDVVYEWWDEYQLTHIEPAAGPLLRPR